MTAVTYPDVLPGTTGLTSISGEVGRLIRLGQWLAENPVNRWWGKNDEPYYQHAFIYLGPTQLYPEGAIIEAEPGGARVRSVNEYGTIYWCNAIAYHKAPPHEIRAIANTAATYVGIPYSFLDYFSIAAHRLHVWVPGLKRYIKSTEHMICSQLCDFAYEANGIQLFKDRWPGYVMPMDLYLLDASLVAKYPR